MVPQQIAGGDIYPALEKGTIDAAEWVGPYDDEKLGFYKVAPYYYYPGWWEGGPTLHVFVNTAKWAELPKAYQAIALNAAHQGNTIMQARYDALNPAALKKLVAAGAQLRPVLDRDPGGRATRRRRRSMPRPRRQNADFKKLYDSLPAFRSDEFLWWQVAEYSFDSFSIRSRAQGLRTRPGRRRPAPVAPALSWPAAAGAAAARARAAGAGGGGSRPGSGGGGSRPGRAQARRGGSRPGQAAAAGAEVERRQALHLRHVELLDRVPGRRPVPAPL